MPYCNTDGSVTASVRTYSAINRNTELADECFDIIKVMLEEKIQAGTGVMFEDRYYGYNYLTSQNSIPVNNNAVTTMVNYNTITDSQEGLNSQLLDCIDKIEYASFLNDIDCLIFDSLVWQDEVDSEYLYNQINTLIHE